MYKILLLTMREVHHNNALNFLKNCSSETYDTIYIDPPFNTGLTRKSARGVGQYQDKFDDFCAWLYPFIEESKRVLKETGTIFLHLDQNEVFHAKVLIMDEIYGRHNFVNHIVWSYDYGGRGKNCWPSKHDDILMYCKNQNKRYFDWEACERIPYMTPALQKSEEKLEKGKVPTDVWWMSIVGTNSKERNGYPTQKPVNLIKRALEATTPKGGKVIDFFAGSGTLGEAAELLNLEWTLVDQNIESISVIKERFSNLEVNYF
jgi:site-specific DNA-methyltransferase (adenine-specific)